MNDSTRSRYMGLGGVFIAVILILTVRLWTMQVINGPDYIEASEQNRVREVSVVAPRGRILDRNGVVLVDNRPSLVVLAERTILEDPPTLRRLADITGLPQSAIESRILTSRDAALAQHTVLIDAPRRVVDYIAEHPQLFPGVAVEPRTVRTYPNGSLAAHVLGYTGGISDDELSSESFIDYHPGDVVGKSGAEVQFESILQGDRGLRTVEVDAVGRVRREISTIAPEPGRDVRLTIDAKVQHDAESVLGEALDNAHLLNMPNADAGAIVALDVKTGGILAMASAPSFEPEMFIGGISTEEWESITSTESGSPLTNRTIASGYAPASTFKPFIGMAALEGSLINANSHWNCQGTWTGMGSDWPKRCWNLSGHGSIGFNRGVAQSCDVVFYEIGYEFYKGGDESLQQYLHTWGFGEKTGVDLPGEVAGRVPDAAWKKDFNRNYPEYQAWLPGDTVNMSIGQGDALATPLQLATAYAGIANGGEMITPHVFDAALSPSGESIIAATPQTLRTPEVSDENLSTTLTALRSVVTEGTAVAAFRGFDVPTAGKTGTAQVAGKDDFALYVGFAPYDDPRYCVAVVIEQGGGGGAVATSAARAVMASLLGQEAEWVQTGQDASR